MSRNRPLPDSVAHILDLMRLLPGVQARAMFGGHGLYRDGLMFAIVILDQLYFKVDDQTVADYERQGLGPFTYTSRGRTASLRYHHAPPEALDDAGAMLTWARQAFEVALRARARGLAKGEAKGRAKAGAPAQASDPSGLPNLGPASQAMLKQAGIRSIQRLRELGAVRAYAMTRRACPKATLNLLWALEGALSGRSWQQVAEQDRASLLMALEDVQRELDAQG